VIKTTVYLDDETALRIKQLAQSHGRSQADMIREALEEYTRKAPTPSSAGWGKFASGRSDVSSRAKEMVGQIMEERRRERSR
jgi:hypothetical protein